MFYLISAIAIVVGLYMLLKKPPSKNKDLLLVECSICKTYVETSEIKHKNGKQYCSECSRSSN